MSTMPSVNVAFIGCCYKGDMYAQNCCGFADAVRRHDIAVDFITSNCGCFSSTHRFGITKDELADRNSRAVRLPYIGPDPNRKPGIPKYLLFNICHVHIPLEMTRGILFYKRARHADIVHYDQVFKAFGFLGLVVLVSLCRLFHKPIIATVHEIDPFQKRNRWMNAVYNHCAQVFVYSRDMADQLTRLGVRSEAIKIIKYGAPIPVLLPHTKTQYIFFGGHNILRGKGFPQVIEALKILRDKSVSIKLVVYVGNGCNGLREAKALAEKSSVSSMIEWKKFLEGEDLTTAYQTSKACLVPYTGGSGRHPVTCAMANGVPVIATRAVDIPEYLGDSGIYVQPTGQALADAMLTIERDATPAALVGTQLRTKAMEELDYYGITEGISGRYRQLNLNKVGVRT